MTRDQIFEFFRRLDDDQYLEYAQVYGDYYATPRHPTLDLLAEGKDVLLEIDVQGALQVRDAFNDAVLIFLVPPDQQTLLKRLESKGVLESTRNGREIVYRASISARSVRQSMVAELVANLFNGDPRELVAHLVRESEIRPGDIERARELLARTDKDKTDE